jgi:prepilin-type processing-associated H-X9-DG protein
MNRWAEPASAGGISGQANSAPGHLLPPINGNDIPAGGPPGCGWSTTNCGPNEEGWSWHPRGTNALMCDGRVRFLAKTVDPRVLRKMVTPDEQLPYADSEAPE